MRKQSVRRGAFLFARLERALWLRASLFTGGAVVAALMARELGPLVPAAWVQFIGEDPVGQILEVMASSMLAVATFSLTAVVAAAGSVTSNASPRAAALLLEDKSAQYALSSFVGAFIFSIVGLIALGTGYYDGPARFVLFLETLVVLGLVVILLLRWMDQVSHMGRINAAIDQVERALTEALARREPFLGGRPAPGAPRGEAVRPSQVGYVQNVDVAHLDQVAARHGLQVHLAVLPGAFLRLSRPALLVSGGPAPVDERLRQDLLKGLRISGSRTFEQDPRYGLVVLAEVAGKALSPAVNDPGSAIDVIGTATRVLSVWAERHWEEEPQPRYRNVTVPGLSAADCFDDVFSPIERDGAAHVEVGIALQKAFADLGRSTATGFAEAARRHSERALQLAERATDFPEDLERLRRAAMAGDPAGF